MSKVFRIYKEGATTYRNWNESPSFPYNSNARDTIDDPDGASAKNEITSIPSPFARIDLVKTAFREVNKLAGRNIKNLEGKTIYHKMVSDSLDVGEIFFNIDKFKGKIEIITWDWAQQINELKEDGDKNHFYFADALDKYLKSDAKSYNFDKLKNIYLLNYINGPDELNIIGATSPSTFFFSNANVLSYINDIYFKNNDKPFDADYQPLYKRDTNYIKSWWILRKTTPNFSNLFPEIETYLNLSYQAITDQNFRNELNSITGLDTNNFEYISIQTKQQNNQVEVIGFKLLKGKKSVNTSNGFTISPDNNYEETLPLILPVEAGNRYAKLQYVNGYWGNENHATYKDDNNIENRILPFDGSRFPYLTISDFLEDTIIRIPHALNTKYYFDGNLDRSNVQETYLLPIKPLFFKYFFPERLGSQFSDGKQWFEMEHLAGDSIHVTLRIPIQGDKEVKYMVYQRTYYNHKKANINANRNDGGIISYDFTGLVMPSVKFNNPSKAFYTVACISTFGNKYRFDFYENGEIIREIQTDCRNSIKGQYDYKAETYTIEHHNFDFIRVTNQEGISNIIVPTFPFHQELKEYDFTVDLGTSNTHIEFKKENEHQSTPYHHDKSEPIMSTFFVPTFIDLEGRSHQKDLNDENDLIAADFIPFEVGINNDFLLPSRTALSYANRTNWDEKIRPFGLANFCLTYNKRSNLAYNATPLVNIKWSNAIESQAQMQAYIANIMLIIRNKVVANNGNLEKTKITWFFPNSMSPRRRTQLQTAWNESYQYWFNSNGFTNNISESVAPIQYYFRRYATATDLINVDIGGGTTDIAFSSNGIVNYITSFKFAANTLFEDSFTELNPNNGIIDWFKGDFLRLLETKKDSKNVKLNDLVNIFKNIDLEGHPANMASFLFSLKDNKVTKNLAPNSIDFNRILQNDNKFKLVFIIFYTAIIYHIAKIIKTKGLNMPRHIAFSGNGSKIINIISADSKSLSKYTKIIFENVLGKTIDTQLDILGLEQGSNPKEATCKGGLIINDNYDNSFETIVLKDSSGVIVTNKDTYLSLNEEEKKKIILSVEEFFDFMFKKLFTRFKIDDYFGVDNVTIKIAQNECKKDLDTYLDKGIQLSANDSGDTTSIIEDALSFYPIKGALQTLSSKIKEYYNEN